MAAMTLKPATVRILMYLFGLSAYENYLSIDIKTLGEQLKLTDRSIISAINELVDNNIILKFPHPTDKRRNDYFINPTAAWKGNSYARRTKIRAIVKETNVEQLALFNDPENHKHSLL
jgi:DNA-binding transcriptional regulator GbsR (MarR family)